MKMESVFAPRAGVGASRFLRPRVSPQIPIALKLSPATDQAPFDFSKSTIISNLESQRRSILPFGITAYLLFGISGVCMYLDILVKVQEERFKFEIKGKMATCVCIKI
ncbi:PREDICTED: uncharacterized protein LOC101307043 isoform 2 [Fragaria vesca subsp. vesca]